MAKIIRTEATPNPNALKFVVDETLLYRGTKSFSTVEEARGDVIGEPLFAIPGVTSVFYSKDFITVNKESERPWRELAVRVYETVPTIDTSSLAKAVEEVKASIGHGAFDSLPPEEKLAKINAVLDHDIRPGLAQDGGGLKIIGLEGYQLKIHYQGACGSCPSSTAGTLRFIDSLLKEKVHADLHVVPA